MADLCAEAAIRFESLGCHVEVVMPTWDDPEEMFRTLASAEAFAAHRERLVESERLLDPSSSSSPRMGERVTAEQYLRAVLGRRELWTEVHRFLARFDLLDHPDHGGDGLPDRRPAHPRDRGQPVSPLGWTPFTFPFNPTGQPAASVPAGFTARGLPVGVTDRGPAPRRSHGARRVGRLRGGGAVARAPAARL